MHETRRTTAPLVSIIGWLVGLRRLQFRGMVKSYLSFRRIELSIVQPVFEYLLEDGPSWTWCLLANIASHHESPALVVSRDKA